MPYRRSLLHCLRGYATSSVRLSASDRGSCRVPRFPRVSRGPMAKDGYVLVKAEVADTFQVRFWLKRFGAVVEMPAPSYLRREMRREALALADLYH